MQATEAIRETTQAERPRKIGKYEIRSTLGEGATSLVYEGFDPDIKRRVAIKILRENLVAGQVGEELLARFRREAISAARCVHPNVVTILEYGQYNNTPFIVMEYVDGISVHRLIKHRLRTGRGISLRRTLTIISRLLKALHAAHELNIVHRDIKASNVLITRKGGEVKLADFGMARIEESSDLTMIGSMIGTPRYMAPELRIGLGADERADVFSAARLFLELLRMMPNDTRIPRARLPEIVNLPPGNRVDYSAKYPIALIPVLIRGLEVDRDLRYQSALEFMRAIKQVLPGLHIEPAPTGDAVPPETPPEAEDDTPASEDELDTMAMLLADFLGPIAPMIMEEHETRSTSAQNLAREIAREIPERDEQERFLARWEQLSESRRAWIKKEQVETGNGRPGMTPLPGELLDRIGNDYAHYIGPIAKTLLRHYASITNDTVQLVKFLAREIPDREQGRRFVRNWLRK